MPGEFRPIRLDDNARIPEDMLDRIYLTDLPTGLRYEGIRYEEERNETNTNNRPE
jgi:hypothetical protein